MLLVILALAPVAITWSLRLFSTQSTGYPTDAEVIQEVKNSGHRLPPQPFSISKELIADYLDPPPPLARKDRSRPHHRFFRCTVTANGSKGAAVTVFIQKTEQLLMAE